MAGIVETALVFVVGGVVGSLFPNPFLKLWRWGKRRFKGEGGGA